MPPYLDEILGIPGRNRGLSASPVPVGQGPGSEFGIHTSVTLLSGLPQAPPPAMVQISVSPGQSSCLE